MLEKCSDFSKFASSSRAQLLQNKLTDTVLKRFGIVAVAKVSPIFDF